MLVTDPETQLADRPTALRMLRARAMAEDGKAKSLDNKMANLGWVVAENLEDQWLAQELVDGLTSAHFALVSALPERAGLGTTSVRLCSTRSTL